MHSQCGCFFLILAALDYLCDHREAIVHDTMSQIYQKMLITGGAGFIGANFVYFMIDKYPDLSITVVDALTYSGNMATLEPLLDRIQFVHADIGDQDAMSKIVPGHDIIVHFAAETHVDRSIHDPGPFLRTNILGTETLLRLAIQNKVKRFHHISTDEVFGSLELEGHDRFRETTPYDPQSPYSASKAASDHLVRSYGNTFGLPYSITNCSNNYGPYHFPEKVIPLFITNALRDKPLPLYGNGKAIRDYLFVEDHCSAIDRVIHEGKDGTTYCVGGGAEKNAIEVAEVILDVLKKPRDLMQFVEDRKGHDLRYAIDATKIQNELAWKPSVSFEEGIARTVQWYHDHVSWWEPLLARQSWK